MRTMGWRTAILWAVLAVALPACTRYPPEVYGFEPEQAYTLDAGDEIRVVVYEVDNLPQTFRVDAGGHISMPLGGVVPVRGKTVQQVERAIAGRLRDRYVKEPKVAVQVVAYRPFFVLGEVRNSGQFPYVNGLTVESAVAIAGGYTERAYIAEARVVRPGPDGATTVSYVPGGYPVRPGDTIYVPERWF
jgi:polysaccharide export outer membrane protein